MASTVPYSPGLTTGTKRAPETSPEDRPVQKTSRFNDKDDDDEEQTQDTGGATGSGEPLLPLREEDEDDVEEEFKGWLQELKTGTTDYAEADVQYPVLNTTRNLSDGITCEPFGSLEMLSDEVLEEAIFTIMEQHGRGETPTRVHLGVEGCMAQCHGEKGSSLLSGDCLVYEVSTEGIKQVTIERDTGSLTKEELVKHRVPVAAGKFKEISGLHALECFMRFPRSKSKNRVDTRWVINWKWVDGVLVIKCRLTMRGFRDRCSTLETFAGTATRSGQRVVNTITAQNPDFVLFSFDVSQAFAKGLTFEEYARLTGNQLREVEFELAKEDVSLIRKLPGYETYDPETEVLKMLKPIYGLKDAPRAWRKRLHQVLVEWGLNQLHAEAELYVKHERAVSGPSGPRIAPKTSIEDRKLKEAAAAAEEDYHPPEQSLENKVLKLQMIISTHVDDLKGGAPKSIAKSLLAFLEAKFGPCKSEWSSFAHTGVQHVQNDDGIFCHQWPYIEQLRQLTISQHKGREENELVNDKEKEQFDSLLGGVAWTVLTRADIAIYVQALQRRGKAPRIVDCRRINIVVRHLTRHKIGVMYRRIDGPVRLIGFTDSAFKAQENEGSGLALRGLAIVMTADITTGQPATSAGTSFQVHLLEWLVRRLRRVVRSTFAAELNALIDSIETLILLQLVFHQVYCGTRETVDQLLTKLEHGGLYPPIDLMVDAKSVSDAIAASEICTPQEASLKLHLITIRDRLTRGLLRSLSWSDTRGMVADALTKGGIDRTMLTQVMQGNLRMMHDVKTYWGNGQ